MWEWLLATISVRSALKPPYALPAGKTWALEAGLIVITLIL